MFTPKYSKKFIKEYERLYKRDKNTANKIDELMADALKHPMEGLGHPERLRHLGENVWSRHIDKKNRLVYQIIGNVILFIQCRGHYKDH
jgi:toxin YoeB